MFFDHQAFVAGYESRFSRLTASQYQGVDQLLAFIERDPEIHDWRGVAYMLADGGSGIGMTVLMLAAGQDGETAVPGSVA